MLDSLNCADWMFLRVQVCAFFHLSIQYRLCSSRGSCHSGWDAAFLRDALVDLLFLLLVEAWAVFLLFGEIPLEGWLLAGAVVILPALPGLLQACSTSQAMIVPSVS